MPPEIDEESLLAATKEAAAKGLEIGFQVIYPWGATAGFNPLASTAGKVAMRLETAKAYVEMEAIRLGTSGDSYEKFTLLAVAVESVE